MSNEYKKEDNTNDNKKRKLLALFFCNGGFYTFVEVNAL